MKIIDILNKKANGTLEDGFKFKYEHKIYTYNKSKDRIEDRFEDCLGSNWNIDNRLNDEVEVIENRKEIQELDIENDIGDMMITVNELVRAVNKLTKESK